MKKTFIYGCMAAAAFLIMSPAYSANNTAAASSQAAANSTNDPGAAFLSANKNKAGVVTTASGLQYEVIETGKGKKPTITDSVTVDYEGKLINGKVFDSSYQRGQPATFPLNQVIAGWQEAIPMMNEGSTWMLYIPAKLAYGEEGAGGVIGPNEALIFKVHLISVNK